MEENTTQKPLAQYRTNRGMLKYVLLSAITLGIYGLVVMIHVSNEINVVARRDGRNTMHYALIFFIFSWLTLGIVPLVWMNNICSRMGNELQRRNLGYSFGAGTFWGWGFFGSLLFGIGSLVFYHKFFKAMNTLNMDYNIHG